MPPGPWSQGFNDAAIKVLWPNLCKTAAGRRQTSELVCLSKELVNWGNDRRGLIGGLVSGFSKMERLLVGPPVRRAAAAPHARNVMMADDAAGGREGVRVRSEFRIFRQSVRHSVRVRVRETRVETREAGRRSDESHATLLSSRASVGRAGCITT